MTGHRTARHRTTGNRTTGHRTARQRTTGRRPSPVRVLLTAALGLALLTGCGDSGGTAEAGRSSPPPQSGPADPSASGGPSASPPPAAGKIFDKDHTAVRVSAGERFSLALEENVSARWIWYPRAPAPDYDVVVPDGDAVRSSSEEFRPGAGSVRYRHFHAMAPGHTKITLRRCHAECGDQDEGPFDETAEPEVTFTVTVRE